jgi:IS605 OrfB family transposase
MKLIAQVKLKTTPEQFAALKKTMEQANAACNYISKVAWETQTFNQYRLHKLVYHDTREKFDLTAQVVVRCIARVADAYKLDRKKKRVFKPLGAITYDDRILRWYVDRGEVSIWTVGGRMRIAFVCGNRQRGLLKLRQGESDVILFREQLFLSATCEIDEPIPTEGKDVLGLDLGVVNLAVDSDGNVYSGKTINKVRHRHRRLRAKLQQKSKTESPFGKDHNPKVRKAARRLLKKLSGKEARFARHTNHVISKQIVKLAKDTARDIALEDLSGIRNRITVRREQRATLHSWSFYQLRGFLEYKSKLAGINLIAVDPRNTSRTCPRCGCVDQHNRPNQSTFQCVSCGYSGLADAIASENIRRLAVNRAYLSASANG